MQLHTAASTLFNKFKGQLCHPDTCTFTFRLLQQSQYFCWVDFVILDNVAQHVDRGQIWAFQRTTQVLTSKISASSSNGIIHESTVNFTFIKICYISLSVALRKSDIFYHCDYCEAWQNLGWSVYLIKINVKPKCWKKPCVHACYIQLTTTVYGWWRTGHQRPTPNMRCPSELEHSDRQPIVNKSFCLPQGSLSWHEDLPTANEFQWPSDLEAWGRHLPPA